MSRFALITGASSGIGAELAIQLDRSGYTCILVARREDRLRTLASKLTQNPVLFALDVTNETSVSRIIEYLENHSIFLEVLVNNAGFGDVGSFASGDIDKYDQMIEVNITALTRWTYHLIPYMVRPGHIMQVASLAGFLSGPNMAVYYATKNYVLSFSEALYHELKDENIFVSAFCPGPVATEFGQVANAKGLSIFNSVSAQSVEIASKKALDGMFKKKPIILSKGEHHVLVFLLRLLPRQLVSSVSKRIQTKKL